MWVSHGLGPPQVKVDILKAIPTIWSFFWFRFFHESQERCARYRHVKSPRASNHRPIPDNISSVGPPQASAPPLPWRQQRDGTVPKRMQFLDLDKWRPLCA